MIRSREFVPAIFVEAFRLPAWATKGMQRVGFVAGLSLLATVPDAQTLYPVIPPLSSNPAECRRTISGGPQYDPEVQSGVSINGDFYAGSGFYNGEEVETTAQSLRKLAVPVSSLRFRQLGFPKIAVVGYSSESCNWVKPQ